MKKLLSILLISVILFGCGQTAKEYNENGINYAESEEYQLAIADYTRAIRIDPDYVDAYHNRGVAYGKLGNYEDAIADYTRFLRINPDYTAAYRNRGVAKKRAGLSYCSDYKKACDLGDEDCCEWYYKQCR